VGGGRAKNEDALRRWPDGVARTAVLLLICTMHDLGKMLCVLGIVLAVVGAILWKTGGLLGLGKLPGDIFIQKGNTTFSFPIVTCIIISVVLTLLSWLFRR
jgi:hypothetical protein